MIGGLEELQTESEWNNGKERTKMIPIRCKYSMFILKARDFNLKFINLSINI